MGIFIRFLLFGGGIMAGWFLTTDMRQYEFLQMAFAILIFTVIAALLAFLPDIILRWRARNRKSD